MADLASSGGHASSSDGTDASLPSASPAPAPFASSLSHAVSSSLPHELSQLLPLVLSYANAFELEMSTFLLSEVLPCVSPLSVVASEQRWSAMLRWHWLTFRDYFPAGRRNHYMASSACAYTAQQGQWVEKEDALSDVTAVVAAMAQWKQRREEGKEASDVSASDMWMGRATFELVSEWAESQRRCVTWPCWVSLLGVNLQYYGPLDFLWHQKEPLSERSKKDPTAPKRAMSAYLLFASDHRAAVKDAQPDMRFGEIAKELARRWKEATADVRVTYERRSAVDKQRYETEMKTHQARQPQRKRRKRWLSASDEEKEGEEGEDDEDDD